MKHWAFDRFNLNYPTLAKRIISWSPVSCNAILVTLDDGSIVRYNGILDTVRDMVSYDGSEAQYRKEFSLRLIEKMADQYVDQSYLSQLSGVSQQSISNYMHGKSLPTIFILNKLATALHCSAADLVDF